MTNTHFMYLILVFVASHCLKTMKDTYNNLKFYNEEMCGIALKYINAYIKLLSLT